MELATDALQAGWTKQRVFAVLDACSERDTPRLVYRQRGGRRAGWDDMTAQDRNALALAAIRLLEGSALRS
jgi:hypothetical protein